MNKGEMMKTKKVANKIDPKPVPDIPVEESLLAKIKAGDKKGIANLKKKSDAGEVIRLW